MILPLYREELSIKPLYLELSVFSGQSLFEQYGMNQNQIALFDLPGVGGAFRSDLGTYVYSWGQWRYTTYTALAFLVMALFYYCWRV